MFVWRDKERDREDMIANNPAMSFKMKHCMPRMIYDASCKHTYVLKEKLYATAYIYNANFPYYVQDLSSDIHKFPK